jgi:hypothetical protein
MAQVVYGKRQYLNLCRSTKLQDFFDISWDLYSMYGGFYPVQIGDVVEAYQAAQRIDLTRWINIFLNLDLQLIPRPQGLKDPHRILEKSRFTV